MKIISLKKPLQIGLCNKAHFFYYSIEKREGIAEMILIRNKKKRIDKMTMKNKKAPDGAFF
ncbi:hypothetical protein A9Z54_02875 [Acinetobacter sp. 51m]|nr:hypothetical protein A9Z54_02875 [Acinetobacter sp. 51m]